MSTPSPHGADLAPSRALLFPGPQPPLSHFGVTLLRYVVATGLRFSLYNLGLTVPESPPVRIHRLRLYLDPAALGRHLPDGVAEREVLRALVDPGGKALDDSPSPKQRGMELFHRTRLRLGARLPRRRQSSAGGDTTDPWQDLQERLSSDLPLLNDAFLCELLTVLDRRRQRAGSDLPPVLSPEAHRFRRGRPCPDNVH